MANIKQAKKRVLQTQKRTLRNRDRKSRIRTFIRKVEEAITSGNYDAAREAFKLAMPEIHKGVSKGVWHKKTAARKLSRLSARIKTLSA